MRFDVPAELSEIRAGVRELCASFPGVYWQSLEPDGYPTAFVNALTHAGWLAALIPAEYGGAGLDLTAASVILEEINASGCNAGACHAQMYTMGTLAAARQRPSRSSATCRRSRAASCGCRRSASPSRIAGSDTPAIQTTAVHVDGGYVVRGQKIWTSRAEHSDLMLLLARTTPIEQGHKRSDGLSTFLVDMPRRRRSA